MDLMMLRTPISLLSLFLGSAVAVNESLFSRRQGICDTIFGGGDDDDKPVDSPDNTRTCNTFVGNGLCTGSDSVYPNCVKTGMTLEDCQQAAVDKTDAVGLSHGTWSGDVGCGLFFDVAFEFSCPDGYNKVSDGSLQGTGPVTGFLTILSAMKCATNALMNESSNENKSVKIK